MRLIDADDLIEIIKNIQEHMREANENPVFVDAREIWTLFIDMVEKQSTAYDVKSIVEKLKELKKIEFDKDDCCDEDGFGDGEEIFSDGVKRGRYEAFYQAIEIVINGGVK